MSPVLTPLPTDIAAGPSDAPVATLRTVLRGGPSEVLPASSWVLCEPAQVPNTIPRIPPSTRLPPIEVPMGEAAVDAIEVPIPEGPAAFRSAEAASPCLVSASLLSRGTGP